jgi:hypothetical protein
MPQVRLKRCWTLPLWRWRGVNVYFPLLCYLFLPQFLAYLASGKYGKHFIYFCQKNQRFGVNLCKIEQRWPIPTRAGGT